MTDELLPCPFCGSPGGIDPSGDPHYVHFGCTADDPDVCRIDPSNIIMRSELRQYIAAWNTRVPAVRTQAELDVERDIAEMRRKLAK